MPADFDRCVQKVMKQGNSKSSAFGICTTQFKKAGKKFREDNKDWHVLEFCAPITETTTVKDDFFIRGIAINETTTRNGVTYIASELEKAAPSFRGKPVLTDHENSVRNIVGRTTENVTFNNNSKAIEFEAKIMDKDIQEMISDGRIQDVSIGASVKDLVENEEDNSITAIGLEGLEISLVAVPGDPGANIANAISESMNIRREILMSGKDPVDYLNDEKGGEQMADEEQTQEEPTEEPTEKVEDEAEAEAEEETSEEDVSEEKASKKLRRVQAELSKYKKAEERAKLKAELKKEVIAELKEQAEEVEEPVKDSDTPAEEESTEETSEEKTEPKDETKGSVGTNDEEDSAEESLVVEKAETGKGFEIWRDYTKDTDRFKRLAR